VSIWARTFGVDHGERKAEFQTRDDNEASVVAPSQDSEIGAGELRCAEIFVTGWILVGNSPRHTPEHSSIARKGIRINTDIADHD